jgi:hypothetical protein
VSIARTIVVVEIDTGSGTRYFSNGEYLTGAGDTPASTSFESRIVGDVTWSRQINLLIWGPGRSSGGLGDVGLINIDGALDDLRRLPLRGNRMRVWTVRAGQAWSTATQITTARIDRVEVDGRKVLRVVTTDLLTLLDDVQVAAVYADTDDVPETLFERPRPVAIGKPLSCPIVLVDEVDYVYDAHDGDDWLGVDVVRDQGFPLTDGVGYIRAVATGRYGIEKLFRGFGRVVADVQGAMIEGDALLSAALGGFDSGLTGWTNSESGNAYLTTPDGGVSFVRDDTFAGEASIGLSGVLTIGQTYLLRVDVTLADSGSLDVICNSVVIGSLSSTGTHTIGFTAGATGFSIEIAGDTEGTNVRIDDLQIYEAALIERLPDVIRYLAVTRGGLEETDIDWDSVAALDTACPWPLGLWIDGAMSVRQALDQVLDSFCGAIWEGRDGTLKVGRLAPPTGSTVTTIDETRLVFGTDLSVRPDLAPGLSLTVAGKRNWYRYTAGELADDEIMDPLVPVLTADYRVRKTATAATHPAVGGGTGAARNDTIGAGITSGGGRPPADIGIGTLLTDADDCQELADHLASLYPVVQLPELVDGEAFMSEAELEALEPFSELELGFARFGGVGRVYKLEGVVGRDRVRWGAWVYPEDVSDVPDFALLTEDDAPLITEDGDYMVTEEAS